MLSFQKLHVYQRSIQFLALAIEVLRDLPKGNAELADQLLARRPVAAAQHRRRRRPKIGG